MLGRSTPQTISMPPPRDPAVGPQRRRRNRGTDRDPGQIRSRSSGRTCWAAHALRAGNLLGAILLMSCGAPQPLEDRAAGEGAAGDGGPPAIADGQDGRDAEGSEDGPGDDGEGPPPERLACPRLAADLCAPEFVGAAPLVGNGPAERCAAEAWADVPIAVREVPDAVYVRADCGDRADGGEGTAQAPLCSLEAAMARGAARIRLGPGRHRLATKPIEVAERVEIEGLCRSSTVVEAPLDGGPLLTVAGGDGAQEGVLAKLSELTLLSRSAGAALRVAGGVLELAGVTVVRGLGAGEAIEVTGDGELEGQGVVVTVESIPLRRLPDYAWGDPSCAMPPPGLSSAVPAVWVHDGGSLLLTDFVVSEAPDVGVLVEGSASQAILRRGVVANGQPMPGEPWGVGVSVESGGSVRLEDVEISDNSTAGLFADGPGTTASMVRGAVVRTRAVGAWAGSGVGVLSQRGATVTVADALLADNAAPGAFAACAGSLTVTGSVLSGNLAANAAASDADLFELRDSRVEAAAPGPTVGGGVGVLLQRMDPELDLVARIEGNLIRGNLAGLYGVSHGPPDVTIEVVGNSLVDNTPGWGGFPPVWIIGMGWGMSFTDNCTQLLDQRGMVAHASGLSMSGNRWEGTPTDHVAVQQHCTTLEEMSPAPPWAPPASAPTDSLPPGATHCFCCGAPSSNVSPTLCLSFVWPCDVVIQN